MKINKYCWSTSDEEIDGCSEDTIKECIDGARWQWLHGKRPFENGEAERPSVHVFIYTTQELDFAEFIEETLDGIPDKAKEYIADNYFVDANFFFSDEVRKKLIAALNPILRNAAHIDYLADELVGVYKVTRYDHTKEYPTK